MDKVTLQKDLTRIRKQLVASERDAELMRQQALESQERHERDQADREQQDEITALREALAARESEVHDLRRQQKDADTMSAAADDGEVQRLKHDLEDLEAELRQKDLALEAKEDELVGRSPAPDPTASID